MSLHDLPLELVGSILSFSTLADSYQWNVVNKQWYQMLRAQVFSRVFIYQSLHSDDFSYLGNDQAEEEDDISVEEYEEYPLDSILMRRGHSAISLDDQSKILVFGGYCGARHCNELFIVDIDKRTVERKVENRTTDKDADDESIMMGRSFHPMVLISENKFLVTGGYCNYTLDDCPNLRDTWIIEFSENDFKMSKINQSGEIPPPMESHSLVYYNGYCITYGGSSYFEDDDLGMKHKDVYALKVDTGVWTRLRIKKGGPPALTGHSCHLISGTNKMILYGGYDQENSTHNQLWMLHIVLPDETKFFNEYSHWEEISPISHDSYVPEPTLYHRSLLLNNRLLVVYGGALDWESSVHTDQFSVFDLETRKWTNLQNDECLIKDDPDSSPIRVYGHTLTYLPNSGRFVVLGGSSNNSGYYKGFSQIVGIFSPYLEYSNSVSNKN